MRILTTFNIPNIRDLGRPLTAEERDFMETPANVFWEAGYANTNEGNWDVGEVFSNSGDNSKPGLLPTPDKVSLLLLISNEALGKLHRMLFCLYLGIARLEGGI